MATMISALNTRTAAGGRHIMITYSGVMVLGCNSLNVVEFSRVDGRKLQRNIQPQNSCCVHMD